MKIKLRTLIRFRRTQLWVRRTKKELNFQLHKHRNQRKLASVLVTASVLSIICLMTGSAAVPASVPEMCAVDAVYSVEEITQATTEVEETTEATTQKVVEETAEATTQKIVEETTEATTQKVVEETTTEVTTQKVVEKTTEATKTGKYSEYEIQLLARLVYGEARGESYEGQVAVAAVVLNRVESKEFPNTIEDVVYQKSQFSCVGGSAFSKTQSKDSSCYKAALAAIAGEDPTNGCLYFYNPKECSPSNWVVTHTTVKKVIGGHNFGVKK